MSERMGLTPMKHTKQATDKHVNVQVAVRCRPPNDRERSEAHFNIIHCDEEAKQITTPGTLGVSRKGAGPAGRKTYGFDVVFGQSSTQKQVYDALCGPIVDEVLEGFNCTVFAYGQTGTGKTHTMEGSPLQEGFCQQHHQDERNAGLIPRAVRHIFRQLHRANTSEYAVRVSHLELYNEHITDLLETPDEANGTEKLRIYDDEKTGIFVSKLTEITVEEEGEVMNILERSAKKRRTAETELNMFSSRSHSIFSITVHSKVTPSTESEELVRVGKLNLVDLAGSENVGRSGALQQRAREAGNINQSLLALGKVINALVERQAHVPYRDSKLTRLLQESLGGRNKTCIIATIGPSAGSLDETISTLEYAFRAKSIRNRPTVNSVVAKRELLQDYTRRMARLERELLAARERHGVFLPLSEHERLKDELQRAQEKIAFQEQTLRDRDDCLTKQGQELEEIVAELGASHVALRGTEAALRATREDLQRSEATVRRTAEELVQEKFVVQCHEHTEKQLHVEACSLRRTLDEAIQHLELLHGKVDQMGTNEAHNAEVVRSFRSDVSISRIQVDNSMRTCLEHQRASLERLGARADGHEKEASLRSAVLREAAANIACASRAASQALAEGVARTLQECVETSSGQLTQTSASIREAMDEATSSIQTVLRSGADRVETNVKTAEATADELSSLGQAKLADQARILEKLAGDFQAEQTETAERVEKSHELLVERADDVEQNVQERIESTVVTVRQRKKDALLALRHTLDAFVDGVAQGARADQDNVLASLSTASDCAATVVRNVRVAADSARQRWEQVACDGGSTEAELRVSTERFARGVEENLHHAQMELSLRLASDLGEQQIRSASTLSSVFQEVTDLIAFEDKTVGVLEDNYKEVNVRLAEQRARAMERTGRVLARMQRDGEGALDVVREKMAETGQLSDDIGANLDASCGDVSQQVLAFVLHKFKVDDEPTGERPLRPMPTEMEDIHRPLPRVRSDAEILHEFHEERMHSGHADAVDQQNELIEAVDGKTAKQVIHTTATSPKPLTAVN